jgi:DNA polymerase-3 subunit delta'
MPFRDMIGHTLQIRALQRALRTQRLPHALIFSGPSRVGKATAARALAAAILCAERGDDDDDACGICGACRHIARQIHPDLQVFRPILNPSDDERKWEKAPDDMDSATIPIQMIRRLRDDAQRRPVLGKHKVYLITQAHRMTEPAQNALLKTLEEPISGVLILLTTANQEELLPTVRSRCWHLPFGFVHPDRVSAWLRETFQMTDEQAQAVAQLSQGRPGLAARYAQMPELPLGAQWAQRLRAAVLVGEPAHALRLTEQAVLGAREAWQHQNTLSADANLSRFESRIQRSAVARLLDDLSFVYRRSAETEGIHPALVHSLEQVAQTKHQILNNANVTLALEVMFLRLIALRARQ